MKSADPAERVREHYGLAVACAKRFMGRGVAMEELISEAEAALLWAAARYDPERGTRFSTYAVPFVLGALGDLCRRSAPMHVPRAEARLLSAAENARQRLCALNGREPTVSELARAVGVEPTRLGEMLAARERMSRSDALDTDERAPSGGGFEDWVLLKDAVHSLPFPYAQVLWLRFGRGFGQADIARRLGVGQPQVSRWERRGKEMLRDALACGEGV